jgi:hypothetical protein
MNAILKRTSARSGFSRWRSDFFLLAVAGSLVTVRHIDDTADIHGISGAEKVIRPDFRTKIRNLYRASLCAGARFCFGGRQADRVALV